VSLASGPWVIVNGTNTWAISVDLFLLADGPLTLEARAFSAGNYSRIDDVNIEIDNSFSNTEPIINFDLQDDTVIGPLTWINGTITDPELPKQEVNVLVSLKPNPRLPANLTQIGSAWVWSVFFNLSDQKEGDLDIYAVANDPYTSSSVEKLNLILDIPNLPPIITLDEFPETLWGPFEFGGSIKDVDDEYLTIEFSFNTIDWFPTKIADDRWNFTYNVSYLSEEKHDLYIRAKDTENQVFINTSINVQGPFESPRIIQTTPISPIEIKKGQNITFNVLFKAGDHRGMTVEWFLDSELMSSSDVDSSLRNEAELDLVFREKGEFKVMLVISNAENSNLQVSDIWSINVLAILRIEPQGGTDITTMVGEAIIFQYSVVEGEVSEVTWTLDGKQLSNEDYLSFMPEDTKEHTIIVTVKDNYGNIKSITYTIQAESTTTTGETVANETSSKGTVGKTVRLSVIIIIGIILGLMVIFAIIVISIAIIKHRKDKKAEPIPERAPGPIAQQVFKPPAAIAQFHQQPQAVYTPPSQPTTYQSAYYQPTQQLTPIQTTPVQTAMPRHPRTYPTFSQSTQAQQLPPAQRPIAPTASYSQQNSCPFCYQPLKYLPGQGGYWCNSCQQFV
ncbi:MAG: hypothetical protein KAJ51_01330, partial [Thermoplasmata archaeon]|nr:hypothetical protein [Thermoplasmata archaeon]